MNDSPARNYPQCYLTRLEELVRTPQPLSPCQVGEVELTKTMLGLGLQASDDKTLPRVVARTSAYSTSGLKVPCPVIRDQMREAISTCRTLLKAHKPQVTKLPLSPKRTSTSHGLIFLSRGWDTDAMR